MKLEIMSPIAIRLVTPLFAISEAYKEYASTADNTRERNHYTRLSLKYKTKAIVGYDRTMDQLTKEYK
jgi:hypothetical protein